MSAKFSFFFHLSLFCPSGSLDPFSRGKVRIVTGIPVMRKRYHLQGGERECMFEKHTVAKSRRLFVTYSVRPYVQYGKKKPEFFKPRLVARNRLDPNGRCTGLLLSSVVSSAPNGDDIHNPVWGGLFFNEFLLAWQPFARTPTPTQVMGDKCGRTGNQTDRCNGAPLLQL